MQSKQQQEFLKTFAGKAMIKGAFSHGGARQGEQAAQTRSALFVSRGGFAESVLEIREWNDPALVFWL